MYNIKENRDSNEKRWKKIVWDKEGNLCDMNNIYDTGENNIINNKCLDAETFFNYLTIVNLYLSKKHKRKIK